MPPESGFRPPTDEESRLAHEAEKKRYTSIEYYRSKRNDIERNIDELLPHLLAGIANGPFRIPNDIKDCLQARELPRPQEVRTKEEYKKRLEESSDKRFQAPDFESTEAQEEYLERNDEALDFLGLIKNGSVNSLATYRMGGVLGYGNRNNPGDSTYRICIGVEGNILSNYAVIADLLHLCLENKHLTGKQFRMKTFGHTHITDDVIIYGDKDSIPELIGMVGDYCYDEGIGNQEGILFGQPIGTTWGTKLPGVRLVAEPQQQMTYNDLQSQIVFDGLEDFVQQEYGGNQERFFDSFFADYDKAFGLFKARFPSLYNTSAKRIVGENANLQNLAFIDERK